MDEQDHLDRLEENMLALYDEHVWQQSQAAKLAALRDQAMRLNANWQRRTYDHVAPATPVTECVFGKAGRATLDKCELCQPTIVHSCPFRAYRPLNITLARSKTEDGELLLEHVRMTGPHAGIAVDPRTGQDLLHPVTHRPIRVVIV